MVVEVHCVMAGNQTDGLILVSYSWFWFNYEAKEILVHLYELIYHSFSHLLNHFISSYGIELIPQICFYAFIIPSINCVVNDLILLLNHAGKHRLPGR